MFWGLQPLQFIVLQLTALTPSLTGTLQYSTSVTTFTFSLSSRVKLCWNLSLLRHQQRIWLIRSHLSPHHHLSSPKPNPCPWQLLALHSAQLQPPGCNHPLTLWKKQLIAQPYGCLATYDSTQLEQGIHVAPKLCIVYRESASPHIHQQPHTILGKSWGESLPPCQGLRWASTSTAQPCYSIKESSQALVHMRYTWGKALAGCKHVWFWRGTPGEPQTFQETSSSHAAAASSAKGHATSHQQNIITPF